MPLSLLLSLAQNSDAGSAVISGVVFHDPNADGKHDTANEKGVGGISIWLFSCDTADNYYSDDSDPLIPTLFPLLQTTETNTLGQYTLNNFIANNVNQYYINVQTPGWYTSTPQWDETAMTVVVEDENGTIIGGIPGVNSVDPTTGNTPCFVLQPNEERIVDIGLVFDVPSDLVIGTIKQPSATPTGGIVDDKAEEETSEPTSSPGIKKVTTSSPSSAPEETTTIVVPNPNNTDDDDEQQQIIEQPSPPTTKPITSPTIIVVPSDPSSNTNNDNSSSSNNNNEGGTGEEMIDNGLDTAITTTQSPSPSITSSSTESPSPSTTSGTTSLTNEVGTTITTPTNDDSTETATQSSTTTTSGQDEDKEDENEEENVLVDDDDDDDVLSEPYTMTLRGITDIEEIDAWVDTTVLHIEQYFNKNENVSNVTVEIIMYDKDQQQMQRQRMMMRRWLQNEDVAAAEVVYQQKTKYQTTNPEVYNESYIALEPFINNQNSYIELLQQLSPYYNDVTSLEVSETLPPTLGDNIDPTMAKNKADNSIIFGSVSGGILLLAGLTLFIYKLRSKKKKNKEYMSSVGNVDDLESARDDGTEDTIRCGNGAALGIGAVAAIGAVAVASSAHGGPGAVSQISPSTSNVMLNIIIPPGIAGIVLDTRPGVRGCAYVCKIKNNCPIKDQIQLEDRIIAVDDEDVQTMNAVKLGKLIAKRSANAQRKITILRRIINTDGNVGGGNLPLILPNDQLVEDNNGATGEETIDVIAPSGKLGIVLVDPVSPDPPGPAFVFNIRDSGPLVDMVKLGDRIIAIDDVDVRTMSAENVSKLLGSKNSKPRRKISILRVNNSNKSQQTSPEVSPRTKTKNNKVVAIRAEIITLCAAMNFPMNQRDDMLEHYVGREEELLQTLKHRKAVQEKGK